MRNPERWEAAKGFVIVLACAAAIILLLIIVSQFVTLNGDDA